MMKKEYVNGDTIVVWKPELCYHSKNCVKNLPEVFNPDKKPWISAESATEDELRRVIKLCPSGALSYRVKGESKAELASTVIEVTPNGPVIIRGNLSFKKGDTEESIDRDVIALCRCGASNKKPYCDGSHSKVEFKAD